MSAGKGWNSQGSDWTSDISCKHFLIRSELNELKLIKEQTDKMLELFQAKNMVEAKKIINKASSEVQKLI
jgi:hypothetical protein